MKGKVRSTVALLAVLALVVILMPVAACDGDAWGIIPPPLTMGTLILDDVMPSPSGGTLFLSTTFNSTSSILWESPVPGCFGSWNWQLVIIANTPGWIIRLSPNYLTDNTLFWCDQGGTVIMVSMDGGNTFVCKIAPTPIIDVAVEDRDILYLADGSNVYKGTTHSPSWSATPANVGIISMLAMAPTYPNVPVGGNILVGGTSGAASFSTDGGANFTPFSPLPFGGNVQMAGDTNYASNSTVYAASSNGKVYRWVIGTSIDWEEINSTIANVSGLAVGNSNLYASDATPAGGANRTTDPTGLSPWTNLTDGLIGETFNQVPSALRSFNATGGNFDLFAIDTTNNKLYRYDD